MGPNRFSTTSTPPTRPRACSAWPLPQAVTGVINLGTGRARRVADVVETLKQHFPDLRANYVASDVAFEASQADMALWSSQIDWLPSTTLEVAIPEIIAFERARLEAGPSAEAAVSPAAGFVLISSLAAKVPLAEAVKNAAHRFRSGLRVMGGDLNPQALAFYYTDEQWITPLTNDENLPEIIAHCHAEGITRIIPTRDGELAFWARHRATLATAGIAVLVSESDAVQRCLDKLEFSTFGQQQDLPIIPASLNIDTLVNHQTAAFVVKERYGAGSLSLGLNLPYAAAVAHAQTLQEPIFQPFIQGREISVDGYVSRAGQVHGLVARTRDVIVRGESQVTTTFHDPALLARLTPIIAQLGLYGPFVLQALLTDDGGLHIIECNCRFGGASTLGIAAGVDSFFWFLQEAAGADLQQFPFQPAAGLLRQVRAAADVVMPVSIMKNEE